MGEEKRGYRILSSSLRMSGNETPEQHSQRVIERIGEDENYLRAIAEEYHREVDPKCLEEEIAVKESEIEKASH